MPEFLKHPHATAEHDVTTALGVTEHGLSHAEVERRRAVHGPNEIPETPPTTLLQVIMRQVASPVIYVLLFAATLSVAIAHVADAILIMVVVLVDVLLGAFQEHRAEQGARALQHMVHSNATVVREGESWEIRADEIVPGDIVLLESGGRVPADMRLLSTTTLLVDESALTGESEPDEKDASVLLDPLAGLGDRRNMAFAGTLVLKGRARGVVVATGSDGELGRIAETIRIGSQAEPPLLIRMRRFVRVLAIGIVVLISGLALLALARGLPPGEVAIIAVALAVSAIPEGLPIALTIALAISVRRMSRRRVIARRLASVEALGSCTYVCTDKTGTLTVNELTVERTVLPDGTTFSISGVGHVPDGAWSVEPAPGATGDALDAGRRLATAAVLCNEATLARSNGEDTWRAHGDSVDVALLSMAHKLGITRPGTEQQRTILATVPFESSRRYAAAAWQEHDATRIVAKGAVEQILTMCDSMLAPDGQRPLDAAHVEQLAHELAGAGYRVLALADSVSTSGHAIGERDLTRSLTGMTLLGLVAMIDPLRPGAFEAIRQCHRAGVEVAMITGDHPVTALAIARSLQLAHDQDDVVTGRDLAVAKQAGTESFDALVRDARVFARVDPEQKLEIVASLQSHGHFVAVTGDGANDAPALNAAHVGVAMGLRGTDVARDAADIVIADDDFASIVTGVEEGRIAYGNVRKVVYLVVTIGVAEIMLFTLALLVGLPPPLLASQVLWLNLVCTGIQDVGLAFEPGDGDELERPPRSTTEGLVNRMMIRRVVMSATYMAVVATTVFWYLLDLGWNEATARNAVLLLMVLFENVLAGVARSETRQVLTISPLQNPLLFAGTALSQIVHLTALHVPGVSDVLHTQPVSVRLWVELAVLAIGMFAMMEITKAVTMYRARRAHGGQSA